MPFSPIVNEQALLSVGQEMRNHTAEFITPISRAVEHTYGVVEGSGTFLELRGIPYILTNEHVAKARRENRLAHFLGNGMLAAAIIHPFQCITAPTDAAVARIDPEILATGTKRPVPSRRIETSFLSSNGEILFIHGFPGKDSHFSATYQGLLTRSCPYATDQIELPPGYDPDLYFAISYPASTGVKSFDGKDVTLPNPGGLSGTVVWDTKYVAKEGHHWSPDLAAVCGLVFLWDLQHQCLIATKIEVVRVFLVLALRQEAAYFRWLNRSQPENDDWADWLWAEKMITDNDL